MSLLHRYINVCVCVVVDVFSRVLEDHLSITSKTDDCWSAWTAYNAKLCCKRLNYVKIIQNKQNRRNKTTHTYTRVGRSIRPSHIRTHPHVPGPPQNIHKKNEHTVRIIRTYRTRLARKINVNAIVPQVRARFSRTLRFTPSPPAPSCHKMS